MSSVPLQGRGGHGGYTRIFFVRTRPRRPGGTERSIVWQFIAWSLSNNGPVP